MRFVNKVIKIFPLNQRKSTLDIFALNTMHNFLKQTEINFPPMPCLITIVSWDKDKFNGFGQVSLGLKFKMVVWF